VLVSAFADLEMVVVVDGGALLSASKTDRSVALMALEIVPLLFEVHLRRLTPKVSFAFVAFVDEESAVFASLRFGLGVVQ
jgi:hypothetical protein